MTRSDLKELIKEIIFTEMRSRSSPVGYNAAIRAAANKKKAEDDINQTLVDKPEVTKSADQILIQQADLALKKLTADFEHVRNKYNDLRSQIDDLDVRMSKREPNETDDEYMIRQYNMMKEKTELEIQSIPYAKMIVKMNNIL